MIKKIAIIIGNKEERIRIILMGSALLCAVLVTFWFHGVLRNDTVFTHLFYLPIIIASIWWRKKGLVVALSLAAVLITSHIQNKMFILNYNDYLRAAIFIVVGCVIANLSEKISNSDKALRKSEERYRNIFNNAQAGMFRSAIGDGTITEANQRIADILGFESPKELMQAYKTSDYYVDPGQRKRILRESRKTGTFNENEVCIRRGDGSIIWVCICGRIYPEAGYLEGVMIEITQEKFAASALKESEEKYRNLFENAQVGIVRSTISDGRVLETNRRAAEIFGYDSAENLKAQFLFSRQYTDKKDREALLFEISSKGRIDNYETRMVRKEGKTIWIRCSARVYPEKGYIEGIMVDITSEKAARDALLENEEALKRMNRQLLLEGRKRQYLSERLIDLLERDRKRISMDLHDQVGQDLTTLKMDLEMVLRKIGPKEEAWGVKINAALDKAVKAIRDIKEISSGLRPSVLDHLGLVPALKELCHIMSQQAGVHIDFFCRKRIWGLGAEKEVAIYRIVQEALTNVVKHSRARKGFVSLTKKEGVVSVSIEDDGVGFEKRDSDGFDIWNKELGLLIMEERAIQLGGRFRVESSVGAGTTLLAEIPL